MRTRLLLLFAFAAATILTNGASAENIAHGVKVVVIDAGHGGKFPGAHYGGVYEKDLTLKVALKLGKLIEDGMPGVKVVYTRKTDKTLGADLAADLQARADIANKAEGDLFISIHANAAPRAPGVRGVETLIMGESSKEQRYNENALFENNREDLIDMSDERTAAIVRAYIQNLQFTYGEYSMAIARCIQNSYLKAGRHSRGVKPQLLRVLYATDMPSALTEIGFMTNAQELAYMKSEKGQNEIARSLYRAVQEYSAHLHEARTAGEEPAVGGTAPKSAEQPAAKPAEKTAEKPAAKPAAGPVTSAEMKPVPAQTPAAGAPATGKTVGSAAAKPVAGKSETAPATEGSTAAKIAGRTDDAASRVLVRYAVQVLASAKAVPLTSQQFRSYRGKVKQYTSDGRFRYKYCVGEYADREDAQRHLREVRRVFPDAFVVCCRGTQIVK